MADATLADLLAAAITDPHGYTRRLPPSLAAMNAIQPPLTEQEWNLYRHHRTNMKPGNWVIQPGGQTSTVEQATVGGPGDLTYNIPTVWKGKELRGADLFKAVQPIRQWPAYADPAAADKRYIDQMHPGLELDTMPSALLYPRRR